MGYKPGDFFLGVIDFFGILVPGAALLFLQGNYLFALFAEPPTPINGRVSFWIGFFVGAYLLGHILMGAGWLLNRLVDIFYPPNKDHYYEDVKKEINLPTGVKKNRTNVYYHAYRFVRLNSELAMGEIERQAADYKLFRSLTFVFLFDLLLAWASGIGDWRRFVLSGVLCLIAGWRFMYLLNWTRRLTFQYYALLRSQPKEPAQVEAA